MKRIEKRKKIIKTQISFYLNSKSARSASLQAPMAFSQIHAESSHWVIEDSIVNNKYLVIIQLLGANSNLRCQINSRWL